jgi:exodeoxyribonuclease V beta subunit
VILRFDPCGPLPTGVTVLEASAGTGKTHTITALAARYVAEGTPLEQILLVTFTRMATGELRERVRQRLVGVERALAAGDPGDDEVARLLLRTDVERRRANLAKALADFDAATIATTHGFCQEALGGLGVAGDMEATFVEDVTDLIDEVVDDLYVRRFHRDGEPPPFTREQAGRIATIAIENPGAPIEPRDAAESTVQAMRRRLAVAAREELDLRKLRTGVMTYDDLLTRLDEALQQSDVLVRRLRDRYRVVLVDEFQDTDPIQWSIFRRAFGDRTLVLIGDPKQAIYAFRGADVYAYLDAAEQATTRATLEVNWRSDQALIDAYDTLFGGAKLGHPGIVYRKVRAPHSAQHAETPLRIRVVHRDEPNVRTTPGGFASSVSAREYVAKDLAADLVRLLSTGHRPGDVAVLVQTNRNAALIRDALDDVDIPAVINGAGSVFGTPPAEQWLRLLEALERPTSDLKARAAALTPFLGWSAERVAQAGDEGWEDVRRNLHEWARLLRLNGVAALIETITRAEGLPERILAEANGERRLTDLRHVGQLLHAAATAEQLGITALASWLRRRIAEADQDTADEDRSRRLESDADAVQVLTVHRSKGLEFPIVYYPFLWEPGYIRPREPVAYHDPENGDARTIDVGLDGPDFDRHFEQHQVEQRGEDLRLAYVALTRARHQAVIWWAGSWNSRDSALGRLLFSKDDEGNVAAAGRSTPTDAKATERFEALAAEAPGCIGVERARLGLPATWSGPPTEPAELSAARFDRRLDHRWRRTSFSDITAGAHEARVTSEPEEPERAEDEPEGPVRAGPAPPDQTPSLLAGMPAGSEIGTFVHRVLEATDFAAPDVGAELTARVNELQDGPEPDVVVPGLEAAIGTPLGLDGLRLRDLTRADRLDELQFELPLVGGDTPTSQLALDAIGAVLAEHGDPLAVRLGDPALRTSVRGFVTGTIDLVARVGERFAVLDYKTNWLAAPGEELTAWHYRPAALQAEMERGHYGLQALLYTVALHRYLRWRLPGYDPERHLAGAHYLFLRGMNGPPGGVFSWQPDAALVQALSDVLDRGGR